MAAHRLLPRSLDPLPDESLPGFLLRLAHRLDLSPLRLATLTGLAAGPRTTPTTIPARHQVHLDDDVAIRFAQVTRLTDREVADLCLDSLSNRYPPLQLDYSNSSTYPRRPGTTPGLAGWLFIRSTRYCPECVGGDASPVQTDHGGSWRKTWRLAPVFACLIHQRLLQHQCPRCRGNAHARRRQSDGAVQSPTVVQHPTLCRTVNEHRPHRAPQVCGTPLTTVDPTVTTREAALPHLLAAQQRLLRRLHLDTDTETDTETDTDHHTARHSFHDLRMLVSILRASWPAAAESAPAWLDLGIIDDHITHQRKAAVQRRHEGKKTVDPMVHSGPPLNTELCAHLLAMAVLLHPAEDHTTAEDLLAPLLSRATLRPAWGRHLLATEHACSPQLRAILAPVVRQQQRPPRGRRSYVNISPADNVGWRFDHRHIPQQLPDTLIGPLLDLVANSKITTRTAHRFLATSLVMLTTHGSVETAGRVLDLPANWGPSAHKRMTSWATVNGKLSALASTVDHAANALHHLPQQINYLHRRQALRHWSISPEDWLTITKPIRCADPRWFPAVTDWGDRKRHISSILVWKLVTRGDHTIAPLFRNRQGTPTERYRFLRLVHNVLQTHRNGHDEHDAGTHLLPLVRALENYTPELIATIDNDLGDR